MARAVALVMIGVAGAARFSRQASESGAVQKTVKGCVCKSLCERNALRSNCDTCTTQGSCGKWAVGGRWDVCKFPYDQGSRSWQSQIQSLWSQVKASTRTTRSPPGVTALTDSLKWSVRTTFDSYQNTLPKGRRKGIHSRGSVCKISWINSGGGGYTGMFAKGVNKGFVRMGLAAAPDDKGWTPGWGFMFPRSGQPAGAFTAMNNLEPGQPWNIFRNNISNHVPAAKAFQIKLLVAVFEQATKCTSMVGLSDMARYHQSGAKEQYPKFPFKLVLTPTREMMNSQSSNKKSIDKLHQEIDNLRAGMTMFTVTACGAATTSVLEATNPSGNCQGPKDMGKIVLDSECRTSQFSDDGLFVRHQRIEEDWAMRPYYADLVQKACARSNRDWKAASPKTCSQRQ